MSLENGSEVFFPIRCGISRHAHESLYLAPDQLSLVKAGYLGDRILEACWFQSKVEDIIQYCSKQLDKPPGVITPLIIGYLGKLVSDGFLSVEPIDQKVPEKYSEPALFDLMILYLHLTDKCNLSCNYCYNTVYRHTKKEFPPLSYKEYELLLRQTSKAGVKQIIFTGGEPLLSPLWQSLAEKVREYGMALVLLTNGTLINKSNARSIAHLFTKVIVSLDSPNEKIHNILRGPDSFKKTIQGINSLKLINYDRLVIRPVLTKINLPSLRDFPFFGRDHLGCTNFEINLYIPNSLRELEKLNLFPNFPEYKRAIDDFNEAVKAANCKIETSCEAPAAKIRCGAGSNILSIGAYGEVFLCQSLHDNTLQLGNILKEDLLEIGRTSPLATYFRKLNVFSVPTCGECNINTVCGGGCRAVAWKLWGHFQAYDRLLCDFNRLQTWQRLWSMAEGKM